RSGGCDEAAEDRGSHQEGADGSEQDGTGEQAAGESFYDGHEAGRNRRRRRDPTTTGVDSDLDGGAAGRAERDSEGSAEVVRSDAGDLPRRERDGKGDGAYPAEASVDERVDDRRADHALDEQVAALFRRHPRVESSAPGRSHVATS